MTVTPLVEAVTTVAVEALLAERPPLGLDADSDRTALFAATVRGVAARVAPYVGTAPPAGLRRDLAIEAITVGVASRIEASLFPEQQGLGDQGRARVLALEFDSMLAQLRDLPADGLDEGDGTGVGNVPAPQGEFPCARPLGLPWLER